MGSVNVNLVNERLNYMAKMGTHEVLMFTANKEVKRNGALVMGAGCARTVRDTFVGIDKVFGELRKNSENNVLFTGWTLHSGFVVNVGAFTTKDKWKSSSNKFILMKSLEELRIIATTRPNFNFHLPMPAINHGGMDVEEVMFYLNTSGLPSNVYVYYDKKPE